MKKIFVYGLLLASFAACKNDEVTLKSITSVNELNDIVVASGTEFQEIPFPAEVNVVFSDNSTEMLKVTFLKGLFDSTTAGTYAVNGTLTVASGTTNSQNLQAVINVVVNPLKLKSVKQDGVLIFEYFYDEQSRLDHLENYIGGTEYFYTYSADNKVIQRIRFAGTDYPEKYFYHNDGTLDRIEFYSSDNILASTHTYTYQSGKISKYENSDQSINGLKFRTFDYDAQNNVSKVSFDIGNPWSYVYVSDKNVATPLVLDLADPQNQTIHPVATFTFVLLSSYTATYTYNAGNYPTEEVRTYPGNGNVQSTFTYSYE